MIIIIITGYTSRLALQQVQRTDGFRSYLERMFQTTWLNTNLTSKHCEGSTYHLETLVDIVDSILNLDTILF
jgi:hypothetical protein